MREIDAAGGAEGQGVRRAAPGVRAHPSAGAGSAGAVWVLRPDGGLDRPDHPLFTGSWQVGRDRPTAAVIVDLSRIREITADRVRGLLQCAWALAEAGAALQLAGADEPVARLLRVALPEAAPRRPDPEAAPDDRAPERLPGGRLLGIRAGGTRQGRDSAARGPASGG
ncbi:hypothetical protein [Streptomyces sp. PSAA01]|uniref:hypothetical protein n=1 Tax=Streptomyces sp. PSAA01 TaxID=2912762 RepID=UPI001F452D2A|nr:hypothetical protein [Streptomyces sp. PSAA01]MCG0286764.1 hypothetical protein [Streptomyces sp. PSAA01]